MEPINNSVDERVKLVRAKLEWNIKWHQSKLQGYTLAKQTLDDTSPLTEATLSLLEMVVKS